MTQWRDSRVSQSTLFREQTSPREHNSSDDAGLDLLASVGTTTAGSSNQGPSPGNHARADSAQYLPAQPTSTAAFGPIPTTFSDINPFCMYGNPIGSFDPSFNDSTTYFPAVSSMPATTQNVDDSSMDFAVIGMDQFGNPVYDYSSMHSW
jgi:hypothetical protein